MPQYKRPFDKGNLFIIFEVEFPEPGWIPNSKLPELEKLLPSRKALMEVDSESVYDVEMVDYDDSTHHTHSSGSRGNGAAYEDDDEPQRPGVSCAQA